MAQDAKKVIELGERILELDHNHKVALSKTAAAYKSRGVSFYDQGHYEWAIDDFSRAINLNPNKADYYFYRGMCYLEKARNEQRQ